MLLIFISILVSVWVSGLREMIGFLDPIREVERCSEEVWEGAQFNTSLHSFAIMILA